MRRVRTYIKRDVVDKVFANVKTENTDILQVETVVDSILTCLRDMLIKSKAGVRIEIRRFGVFEVKQAKPKPRARNPKTNETISVPARRKVHFKPGKIIQGEMKKPVA